MSQTNENPGVNRGVEPVGGFAKHSTTEDEFLQQVFFQPEAVIRGLDVTPEDFYSPLNAEIWKALCAVVGAYSDEDLSDRPALVVRALARAGQAYGGQACEHVSRDIISGVAIPYGPAGCEALAGRVRHQHWQRRQVGHCEAGVALAAYCGEDANVAYTRWYNQVQEVDRLARRAGIRRVDEDARLVWVPRRGVA